jgi:hypothetical protein
VNWIDRLMDWLTSRRMKLAGSGHPVDDTQPETGSPRLSDELEADYGPDTSAAERPSGDPRTGQP